MKKRYWIIGGLLLYAVIRQASVTDHDTVPTRPPPSSESISKPVTGSRPAQTGTSKLKVDPAFPAPSPATSTDPSQKPEPPRTDPLRLVRGKRVALRAGPSISNAIFDRFDEGRQVLQIEQAGDWSRVQDQLTRQEGWMASRFLAEQNETTEDRPCNPGFSSHSAHHRRIPGKLSRIMSLALQHGPRRTALRKAQRLLEAGRICTNLLSAGCFESYD